MAGSGTMSSYWQGLRQGIPFSFVVFPFGILFGVLAIEAGLNVYEALAFSAAVIAGAAQFTALQLMSEHAPTFVVVASALAVNLRVAMYSASITPHLGAAPLWQRALASYFLVDQTYALSFSDAEQHPDRPISERIAFYFGSVTVICLPWFPATIIGSVLGQTISSDMGIDFAMPLAFLAMIAPMLRSGAHVVAALTSIVLALCFSWVPYNLALIFGGLGGMMAGARTELWMEKRRLS